GKAPHLSRARRPFELELIADDRGRIEILFECENLDELAAGLAQMAERLRLAGQPDAELFLGLAARRLGGGLAGFDAALGQLPGAGMFVAPERAAGMDQQNLERSGRSAL